MQRARVGMLVLMMAAGAVMTSEGAQAVVAVRVPHLRVVLVGPAVHPQHGYGELHVEAGRLTRARLDLD